MNGSPELPKCPGYVAHPQSVWFETHWRPIFESVLRERDELKDLFARAAEHVLPGDIDTPDAFLIIFNQLKAKLKETDEWFHKANDARVVLEAELSRYRSALDQARTWMPEHAQEEIALIINKRTAK